MSQRTRGHTTGAAAKPTKSAAKPARLARDAAPAPHASDALGQQTPAASPLSALNPDTLARALRAVATELERDPALAQRVAQAMSEPAAPAPSTLPAAHIARSEAQDDAPADGVTASIGRSFRPTIVTGIAETLGPGVPDPFALRQRLGEDGLREALDSLRLGSLRAIIRQHGLDASGSLSKLNDAAKLRAHILAAARKPRS